MAGAADILKHLHIGYQAPQSLCVEFENQIHFTECAILRLYILSVISTAKRLYALAVRDMSINNHNGVTNRSGSESFTSASGFFFFFWKKSNPRYKPVIQTCTQGSVYLIASRIHTCIYAWCCHVHIPRQPIIVRINLGRPWGPPIAKAQFWYHIWL